MPSDGPPKPSSRSEVARRLLEVAAAFLDPTLPTHVVVARLETAVAWVKSGAPPKPKPAPRVKTAEQLAIEEARKRAADTSEQRLLEGLWQTWQEQTRLTWGLTPERRGRLLVGLRAHGAAKIEAAIRGMVLTQWANGTSRDSPGETHYEVHIILKHIDAFADKGGYRPDGATVSGPNVIAKARIAKLEKEKADALRRGDLPAYDRLRLELEQAEAGGLG